MSEEGDTFWVTLFERVFGLLLIVIGAMMLYFTLTTSTIGGFTALFSFLGVVLIIVGILMILIKPPE
jgi:hypothetical protein